VSSAARRMSMGEKRDKDEDRREGSGGDGF
jgi:hypothetical protein